MRTTTVSQLKMSLSAYLRQVKAGEEVVVTEHGRPIARLLPGRAGSDSATPQRSGGSGPAEARCEAPAGGLLGPPAARGPAGLDSSGLDPRA